ncbi:hypothetical protein Celaphus_00016129, partial [Cervus elaphus hippelaphus]
VPGRKCAPPRGRPAPERLERHRKLSGRALGPISGRGALSVGQRGGRLAVCVRGSGVLSPLGAGLGRLLGNLDAQSLRSCTSQEGGFQQVTVTHWKIQTTEAAQAGKFPGEVTSGSSPASQGAAAGLTLLRALAPTLIRPEPVSASGRALPGRPGGLGSLYFCEFNLDRSGPLGTVARPPGETGEPLEVSTPRSAPAALAVATSPVGSSDPVKPLSALVMKSLPLRPGL